MSTLAILLPGLLIGLAVACAVASVTAPTRGPRIRRARRARDSRMWRRAAGAVVAGVAAGLLTGWPVAVVAAAAGAVALPPLLARDDARAVIDKLDALAAWVRRVADRLNSGAGGLEQAIAAAARTAPSPLADEVRALAVRVRTRGLEPALRSFADDVGDPAADEVVGALIVRARAGGRGLVGVLEGKADALAAAVGDRREVEADRAKPRTDTRIIITITATVLAGLVVLAGEFLAPFSGLLGQLVMAASVGIMALACWWMHLLSRVQRRARLFASHSGASGVRNP
ncbi:type II secretion system F family protein [Prauserella oleivorans]|uniref:Type II secretion system F family protein n=1 Tax=Prauserella oleivorans TaxID=1478153 RepID=A0ABW5WGQ1_9PSEU